MTSKEQNRSLDISKEYFNLLFKKDAKKEINSYASNFLNNICNDINIEHNNENNLYIRTDEFQKNKKKDNKPISRSNLKKERENKEKKEGYVNPILNAHVYRIQKAMKNYYIKSKNLPDNYFYVQKLLKFQYQRRLKNYEDNANILFSPNEKFMETESRVNLNKTFETERLNTKNKFYTHQNCTNYGSNNKKNMGTVFHNPYEDGKIHLFAKIMDIDIMVYF